MNKVILLGNLTKDPVKRTTASGKPVTSFSVACQRRFKNQDGQYETDYVDCVAWNQTAEFVERHFKKGSRILVEGSLRTRSYEDKQGDRRYVTEVWCDNVEFGGSKTTSDNSRQEAPRDDRAAQGDFDDGGWEPADEDALPF